jgi:hypothetical protein
LKGNYEIGRLSELQKAEKGIAGRERIVARNKKEVKAEGYGTIPT